jgi:hypothetical protein
VCFLRERDIESRPSTCGHAKIMCTMYVLRKAVLTRRESW